MENLERVMNVVCEQLVVNQTEVNSESEIINDLGADSLDVVELVMAIEEEFDIEISDEAAEKIMTVGDIVTAIEG